MMFPHLRLAPQVWEILYLPPYSNPILYIQWAQFGLFVYQIFDKENALVKILFLNLRLFGEKQKRLSQTLCHKQQTISMN